MEALTLYADPDRLTHMNSAGLTHPAGTQPGGDSYVICV